MEPRQEARTTSIKRVGILGGMGPLATMTFCRLLIRNTAATADQDHVPLVIDSDPRIPDRTAFLLGQGEDPRPALRAAALRLAAAGAQLLVVPCNTANAFADDIEEAAGLPVVPWIETAVAAVTALGTVRCCGLLATNGTLRAGLYARALAAVGITTIEPDEPNQAQVMGAIYAPDGVKASADVSHARRSGLLSAAQHLVDRGADTLLLACTELPIAIQESDPSWPVRAIDPAIDVARLTITLAGAAVTPQRVSL